MSSHAMWCDRIRSNVMPCDVIVGMLWHFMRSCPCVCTFHHKHISFCFSYCNFARTRTRCNLTWAASKNLFAPFFHCSAPGVAAEHAPSPESIHHRNITQLLQAQTTVHPNWLHQPKELTHLQLRVHTQMLAWIATCLEGPKAPKYS